MSQIIYGQPIMKYTDVAILYIYVVCNVPLYFITVIHVPSMGLLDIK